MSMPRGDADEMLDGAACGLMETDARGVFLRVNLPFCVWVGYDRSELIGKRRLQDLLTMGGRIFHQTHWAPLLEMQGSISEIKLDVRHRDGSLVPMMMNAVRRGHGPAHTQEVAAFVARDRDKYEQELLRSRKKLEYLIEEAARLQAEATDRALFAEQMVGIVSHDLRNPLSAVHTGIQVLFKHAPTDNQARVLSRMAQSVDRANRLIADLLDFTAARIGQGIAVSPRLIDLHELVAQSIEELALAFPGRSLRHQAAGAGRCCADPDRLSQLVGNLVANAVAYGDPFKEVTVTTSTVEHEATVQVHNWGPAIPPAVLPTLFQPMVRGRTAAGTGRSVGLGLFIIMEIVRAHGGRVNVESSDAGGTTFRATVPTQSTA
jgi:sigma-B regulation protein RsbU (phosphoserine phosphatase)